MLRRFACLVSLLAMFSGCAGAPHAKMIGGGLLATTGVVIAAHQADGHCFQQPGGTASDVCDAAVATPANDVADMLTTVVGIGLIALGGGLIISGIHETNEPPPAPIARTETPPPPVQRATALPADVALRDRLENRLAIQASLTAHTGNCSAAILTANSLAQRDPALHARLLAVDAELARCYSQDVAR